MLCNAPNGPLAQRHNPLRDLIAEKQRAAELTQSNKRMLKIQDNVPATIENEVNQHMERLETRLLRDFQEFGRNAVERSAAMLTGELAERLDNLEQISAVQSRTIVGLKNFSFAAEHRVGGVVDTLEKTLSDAVPGFRLELSRYAESGCAAPPRAELVKAEPQALREIAEPVGKYVFCPNCTSTKIRRANRAGIWEEFLRLFFIAPFRCRSCRHKFYRF